MPDQSTIQNRILARLPAEDFDRIAEHLEHCVCPRGMMVAPADEPISFAYFLESGIASIVATSPEGQKAEAGIIGREGFVHPALVLGTDRMPLDIQTQMPGTAHRMPAGAFTEAFQTSAALRQSTLLFVQANAVQSNYTTLSNAVHDVEERLARWLLMCHDRSDSNDLHLTHHFMGLMLSVRRVSVTNALHSLEGNGYIELSRGYVTILNRNELEDFAGDAYGRAEAEYERLLGPL